MTFNGPAALGRPRNNGYNNQKARDFVCGFFAVSPRSIPPYISLFPSQTWYLSGALSMKEAPFATFATTQFVAEGSVV